MKTFWVRMVNVTAIVLILAGYNTVLAAREKEDEIAKLNAELETVKLAGQAAGQSQTGEAEGGGYADGVYTGEGEGFGGAVSVEVTVEQGKITDITVLSAEGEDGAYLAMAQDIIPDIIDKQSADTDTISGATFSSTGIKNAVIQALEKAAE